MKSKVDQPKNTNSCSTVAACARDCNTRRSVTTESITAECSQRCTKQLATSWMNEIEIPTCNTCEHICARA